MKRITFIQKAMLFINRPFLLAILLLYIGINDILTQRLGTYTWYLAGYPIAQGKPAIFIGSFLVIISSYCFYLSIESGLKKLKQLEIASLKEEFDALMAKQLDTFGN